MSPENVEKLRRKLAKTQRELSKLQLKVIGVGIGMLVGAAIWVALGVLGCAAILKYLMGW